MFRKIITNLAYSPALADELTAYARRLKHEETKRQIGLIFVVLAFVIQSFAIFFPPESANAGTTADFIEGGVGSVSEYLSYYDQDAHNIKDLLASLGISRADVQAAQPAAIEIKSGLSFWKMTSRGDGGDTPYDFLAHDGTTKTVYYRPLGMTDGPDESLRSNAAYVGFSATAGWFALLKHSGNLVTKTSDAGSCASGVRASENIPVPLSLGDIRRCHFKLIPTISAQNLTSGSLATSQSAQASDRIVYTLSVANNDASDVSLPISIGLSDLLDYAELLDKGGAALDEETSTLTWAAVTVPSGSSLERSFVVRILPVIPSTATGTLNPSSYDCTMSTSFGNTLRVPVSCPFPKAIERITGQLPRLSQGASLTATIIGSSAIVYFYARSRQLRTELRLIRHNYQGNL